MSHFLNATPSKVPQLPPELWSTIFQLACPVSNVFTEAKETILAATPFHLVLRSVSTLWRDIVQSTPHLWAFVCLPKLCPENVDIKGRYLKLCLECSGGLPLTLSFRFAEELREANSFISPTVDETLELLTHRVRVLRLLQPPRSWLEKLIPKMCQLTTISLSNAEPIWSPRNETIFFPEAANISHIRIMRPCLLYFRFDCATSSVTHVDLCECPVDFVMEVLLRCPNLIEFRSLSLRPPSRVKNPCTMFTSPFVLSHLSSFARSTSQAPDQVCVWDITLFEYIHFPALKRFTWWADLYYPADNAPVPLPLSKIPKSMTILEFKYMRFSHPQRTSILNHFLPLAGVAKFRLVHCNEVEQALFVLSQGTDRSDVLFPELTSIEMDYSVVKELTPPWPEVCPEFGRQLVQMLQRRVGLIDEFTLTAEMAHLTRHWDATSWDALRKLKRNGLKLTIVEYGHPINI